MVAPNAEKCSERRSLPVNHELMRIINIRPTLETIFHEEETLPSRFDSIEHVQWNHCDIYRVSADGLGYVVHATAEGREQLARTRRNLLRLGSLGETGIPRVAAWRDSGEASSRGQEWAILISTLIPGAQLNRRNFNDSVWSDLKRLLHRIHSAQTDNVERPGTSTPVHEVGAFAGVADALKGLFRLLGVPLASDHVGRHLESMTEYLNKNAASFKVPARLVHGDLNRSNILSDGGRAGIVDWAELDRGDYAYDLATLKFALDSVIPERSAELLREQAIEYRSKLGDDTLELRLRFFLALPGLVTALSLPSHRSPARAWRARTCFLHSEAQWRQPLRLTGPLVGAPAAPTAYSPLAVRNPVKGLAHMLVARWMTR